MKLIVACDINGGIGYNNRLPWSKIENDLPRFKRLTDNQIIVMGKNTWESLPVKPLPNRTNLIITSTYMKNLPYDAYTMSGIEEITDEAWIIGGAQLINTSWHRIKEIHLSRVTKEYQCDAFIDLDYITNNFTCISTESLPDHTYEIWKKYDKVEF